MPSQGHNYSPFPPAIPEIPPIPANSAASNASTSGTFATASMTDQVQYYPYYPSPTQYQSQVYSQQYQQYPFQGYQYYQQPIASTNYAQAYIDATYSATFQQVAPPSNSQNLNYQRSNQNSWKKNQRLPVAYCNDCSRPFYSNLDYQNHLKCHVDCPDCGLTLTKKQLVSHRNDAHPKLV